MKTCHHFGWSVGSFSKRKEYQKQTSYSYSRSWFPKSDGKEGYWDEKRDSTFKTIPAGSLERDEKILYNILGVAFDVASGLLSYKLHKRYHKLSSINNKALNIKKLNIRK